MTDEAGEIQAAEEAREGAKSIRRMFNAYLAEGFTEVQAIELCKAMLMAANQ